MPMSYEEMIRQLNEAQMELKIRYEQASKLASECSSKISKNSVRKGIIKNIDVQNKQYLLQLIAQNYSWSI